jgi:hypothetical protein
MQVVIGLDDNKNFYRNFPMVTRPEPMRVLQFKIREIRAEL